MQENYHNPVLLDHSSKYLLHKKNGIYVDCTFGGGGHSKEFLKKLDKNAKLIAFDQDQDTLQNILNDKRFILILCNFKYLQKKIYSLGINQVDGIFLDLGVSSHQLNTPARGFSTRFNSYLDMRMNLHQDLSAMTVVNKYTEKQLKKIFFEYGELRFAPKIAKKICYERRKKLIKTTGQLKDLFNFIPKNKSNKILAQIFQAIRIEVNDELNILKILLFQAKEILATGGRLAIISYHSLEDRIVKNFFKTGFIDKEPNYDIFGNWKSDFELIKKKPITADMCEIQQNPRSRSAKLRIVKKL